MDELEKSSFGDNNKIDLNHQQGQIKTNKIGKKLTNNESNMLFTVHKFTKITHNN